jgi:hypothetical protein
MRALAIFVVVTVGTTFSFSQQAMPKPFGEAKAVKLAANASLEEVFQAKVKDEWEAIKNKDKKAYGELLADDYEGVEVDGRGERNKVQAVNELGETNIFNYTLWGFRLVPLPPDGAFVVYEVTMQFPPKAQVRFSRVYITELWRKREGTWKEVHYQETHVK